MEVRLIAVVLFNLVISVRMPRSLRGGKRVFLVGQSCNQLKDNEYLHSHIQIRLHQSLCSLLFPCRHTPQGVNSLAAKVCIETRRSCRTGRAKREAEGARVFAVTASQP